MSTETLAIYDKHRKEQVEEGTFSETFTIVASLNEFKGVFDESHFEKNRVKEMLLKSVFFLEF